MNAEQQWRAYVDLQFDLACGRVPETPWSQTLRGVLASWRDRAIARPLSPEQARLFRAYEQRQEQGR